MRRPMLFLTAACLLSSVVPSQGSLREQLKDSASERWIYEKWPMARRQAEKENKPIFAVFRCVP